MPSQYTELPNAYPFTRAGRGVQQGERGISGASAGELGLGGSFCHSLALAYADGYSPARKDSDLHDATGEMGFDPGKVAPIATLQ